jgi:electron transport complex protein RnfA
MKDVIILVVFSGLTLNLMLQMGLGIRDIGLHIDRFIRYTFFQWGILFFSVFIFWFFFSYILSPLALGYLEYFLLFPLASVAGKGFEAIARYFFPFLLKVHIKSSGSELFSAETAYNGLIMAALVLTLRLAGSIAEAVVLSLGFSLGGLMSALILRDIHRRSFLERVPQALRGMPLLLISMGLMALIFSSLAVIFLRILEG